ncbi:hypothetical protein GCM10018781_14960 [Kitasatospora indigofera]|uniref:Uncharacterized protein n=1 Tax=Kitasatospora indigofera TaxID=67307 RepID=A0A919KMI8_9ACTN|nr:hypothetical protein GCM10018781_14960 [Kitasatospora indigofera]
MHVEPEGPRTQSVEGVGGQGTVGRHGFAVGECGGHWSIVPYGTGVPYGTTEERRRSGGRAGQASTAPAYIWVTASA